MKSRASAKEEKKECNDTISHGGFSLRHRSLWLVIFTGIIFFVYAHCCLNLAFSLSTEEDFPFSQGKIKYAVLDNGMRLILKENHSLPLVSLFLCVSTGSGHEGKFSASGISHFTEHMVFKGTASYGVGDIFREIESYGGRINAVTSYDYTGYKVTLPSEFVYPALKVLGDMVMNAVFNEEQLEKEREVVLREIKLSLDDPQRYASRSLWQSAYSVHPYRYPILGEEQLFRDLTRKDLLEFYQTRYVPNNMILAIVGDVQEETTLSFVRGLFKGFQKKELPAFDNEPEPKQDRLRKFEKKFTAGLTYLAFGFHSVALTDEDCFALDVLATILGEGELSRLYNLICNKRKLAYSIEAMNYTPREPGLFIIYSLLEESKRRRVQSLILKQLELIKRKKVSEDELERAKNTIVSDILFHTQTIAAQAHQLAINEAISGDFRFTEKYVQKIREVDADDIQEVARKYLLQDRLSIVALVPQDKSRETTFDKDAIQPLKIGIENLKKTKDETPAIQKYVLDNGLTLLVRENKELPIVSIKAVFKGGLRAENKDLNGLFSLMAALFHKGTRAKNSEEIAFLIESKGARFSGFSGNNSFGLSLDILSRDLDEMLELFADLVINSTFSRKEFERQKQKQLARLKAIEDDIFESGTKLFKQTLFRNHPYRFLTSGNKQSLNRLRRKDLMEFYRNFCVGENMVLAVFGDVDRQETLLKVKKYFAALKSGDVPYINPPQEAQTKSVRTSTQTLPKKQSLLLLGFRTTDVFDPDKYALELISQILSQASGRLFTQIREKKGLAYTLGAYSVLGLDPGYLLIYVATTAEHIEEVKEEILRQLSLLKEEHVTAGELAQAKRKLLGARLIARQTNAACAFEGALDELYGLGFNHYLEHERALEGIEVEDITRCANKYFDLNNYAVVILGPEG